MEASKTNAPPPTDSEAIALVRQLNKIELSDYRVIGGIVRYSQSARNSMKDAKQRIVASLTSRPYGCDNYLLWAPPGSGKSFFVQEIAKSLGDSIYYREINLAQSDEAKFRQALSELQMLDKPCLCFIDEVDSKPAEMWPYEALLPSLEPPSGRKTTRTCFILAGSSGGSTLEMKEAIAKRPKGTDLLSRIPPGNEFEIEGLGLGDRLLVASTQFLNAARDDGRDIHEVEKLVLYYVAQNPRLKSARNIRQQAVRCMERIPAGEDRIRYDYLFDAGDAENKEFWNKASPFKDQLVNVFVSLDEGESPTPVMSRSVSKRPALITPPSEVVAKPLLDKNRIAVMPLVNLISDPTDEYFADGMTEELISAISLVNGLSVISRTSIMSYKNNPNKRTIDIGNDLSVGTLLEGSVRKAGDRVRISVQLIDVQNDQHLWAQNYDRNLEDVFAIQSDIASKVADSLESKLLPGKKHRIETVNSKNVSAHLLYLKGRASFYDLTREALESALKFYESAIELDPRYALAYAAIAETYFVLATQDYLPSEESEPKIGEYANKALSLDNSLPEAHLALGHLLWSEWNFQKAEVEYRRAIELNPNFSFAHSYLSILLSITERYDEARAEAKRALDLDPLSSLAHSFAGFAYLKILDYDKMIEVFEKAVKLDPLNAMALENLGLAHFQKGMFDIGLDEMVRGNQIRASNFNPMAHAELAYAYAKAGYDDKPREILSRLLEEVPRNPGWATAIAGVYSVLGEKEKAFDWLEKAYKVHSGSIPFIASEVIYDNIRSDARFNQFLIKVGLGKSQQKLEAISGGTKLEQKPGVLKRDSQRIAVLPFTNISPDPKDEYFADGMTEELISTLSKIRELKVISRTSVMRYKQSEKSLSEIASELNVNAILEGSVRKMGDDLRITAQLIDVQNDEHLWSEDYDRKFENVFLVQRDIATKVAESLSVNLLGSEKKAVARNPTNNLTAYALYLKGLSFVHGAVHDSGKTAISYFEQALNKDPNFAEAHAGIAASYSLLAFFELMSTKEALAEAETHARKALEINSNVAEAHVSLGSVKLLQDLDPRGAEAEYQQAIELSPSLAIAHLDYAWLSLFLGDFERSKTQVKLGLSLDPLSADTLAWGGALFLYSKNFDDAIETLKSALELEPGSSFARTNLGNSYVQKGMTQLGIAEITKAASASRWGDDPTMKADLAYAFTKAGDFENARKILEELLGAQEKGRGSPTAIAEVYASLGEKDRAFEWLEEAFKEKSGYLYSVTIDYDFENLWSDSRFENLVNRLNLPPRKRNLFDSAFRSQSRS